MHIVQIIRSTNIDAIRTDTCNKWVREAALKIAALPREYWDNDDYVIEQVWFIPSFTANFTEHALLRLRFKNDQNMNRVVYFDNGAFGDSGQAFLLNPRISGGIAFPENIPTSWNYDEHGDRGLDDIAPDPGRTSGFGGI